MIVEPMRRDIQDQIGSPDNLKLAHINWIQRSKSWIFVNQISDYRDLDEEVNSIEKN